MYRVSARNPYTPCIAQYHLNLILKVGSCSVGLEIGWSYDLPVVNLAPTRTMLPASRDRLVEV